MPDSDGRKQRTRKAILITALAVSLGALFAIGINYGLQAGSGAPIEPPAAPVTTPPPIAAPTEPEPEPPPPEPEFRCPLDGTPLDDPPPARKPLAIVVDNNPAARPQDGLDSACVVYEVPVEGGLTRFVAFFLHTDGLTVGPVRSARDYMIDLAQGHDAVLSHCGGSPAAQLLLARDDIHNLDDMKGARGFFRVDHRRAPHNLYVRTSGLWEDVERRGWEPGDPAGGLVFDPDTEREGETAIEIEIPYPGGSTVKYIYEEMVGRYLRFIGSSAHRDARTGLQLEAANIIIQSVTARVIPGDTEGRLAVTLVGVGKALIATGGVIQTARWVRPAGTAVTRYIDTDGNEITLTPGPTWVQILPSAGEVKYR